MAPNEKYTGYLDQNYAKSFNAYGQPIELPECGGWLIKRKINGRDDCDAMGCYPLFTCKKWKRLHIDLEALAFV